MYLVGLTGGIGSGKSIVADLFGSRGAGVVDTDLLARELTRPHTPILAQLAAEFGDGILTDRGELDRARLRRLVFANPQARTRLESILHPPIRDLMLERARGLTNPYVLLVIPLLFETGQESLVQRVLVVDCPESIQIERVARRSGLAQREIEGIIASQIPRAQRLALADDRIDNQGDVAALTPQVESLHRAYLALAEDAGGVRTHTHPG